MPCTTALVPVENLNRESGGVLAHSRMSNLLSSAHVTELTYYLYSRG